MPPTSLSNRSKSVGRNRPTETSARCIARESAELSTAAASTTSRSLSVSFQGESLSYQTSKARLVSPSPIRKPTPERRTSIAPSFKSESFRPSENHHRWAAARTQQCIALTRSLNCSVPDNDSVLVLDEGARRASFDGGDFSLPFYTDILSSGGNSEPFELNARSPRIAATTCGRDVPARFLLEEGVSWQLYHQEALLGVQRVSIGPARSFSDTVPFSCNAASMFGMGADIKRGTYVERQLEDAHRLRLLNNRHLQWWWVNAQVKDTFLMQKLTAEKRLYGAWITIAKMHKSLAVNKLQLQTKKQYLKFSSILKGQVSSFLCTVTYYMLNTGNFVCWLYVPFSYKFHC
ncbi:QWRF motif-containing protein 2-like [Zingiber officinale]|uniref:QWRF motif-containing protein 2-like n=1 Tax=Zingiber officinale TaxID=94328 RepID=UPI001C4D3AA6|nr:QWRF motif-containing protein 2-like [Zingiber officinale]